MTEKQFVLGFAFGRLGARQEPSDKRVAMIRKTKPEWQKGMLNGIGGHIEVGELPHEAMVREFREETGATVGDWDLFAELIGMDWRCYVYRAYNVDLDSLKTTTEEEVVVIPVDTKPNGDVEANHALYNLNWLIPLAYDVGPCGIMKVLYGD